MTGFCCEKCDMKINDLVCGKCQSKLEVEEMEINGNKIKVCTCPNGCGKVKCPQCCGQDMKSACCKKENTPCC